MNLFHNIGSTWRVRLQGKESLLRTWLGPVLLLGLGVGMAGLSWQKWPDVLTDFGQQLYVPWRLSRGSVLYRDIAFIFGPFSAYFNAWVFKLFGTSLLTHATVNMALIAVLAILIYRIFLKTTDATVALFTTGTFLGLFAFSQYVPMGNFNFVTPYSQELTHGIILSFLSIYVFLIYVRQRADLWLGVIGLLLGLVFLTKPEVFLALCSAMTVGVLLTFLDSKFIFPRIFKLVGIILVGFFLPVVGFAVFFSFSMPLDEAILSIVSPYTVILKGTPAHEVFYLHISGFDDLVGNLGLLFEFTEFYVLIILMYASLAILLKNLRNHIHSRRGQGVIILFTYAVIASFFYFWATRVFWSNILRPLPLVLLVFGLYLSVILLQHRDHQQQRRVVLPLLVLTVFALTLLFKMILNVHVWGYGFALAMPATLVLTMVLVNHLPRLIGKYWGVTMWLRVLGCVLVSVAIVTYIGFSKDIYDLKTYAVGSGSDVILDYGPDIKPRGAMINRALKWIEAHLKMGETMAVVPDGVMLNYWSRLENPTPFCRYAPFNLKVFGERRILDSLKRNPPDYIVLVDRDFSEVGPRYFGKDYGASIFFWITANYKSVERIGKPPMSGQGFGIIIAKRKPIN